MIHIFILISAHYALSKAYVAPAVCTVPKSSFKLRFCCSTSTGENKQDLQSADESDEVLYLSSPPTMGIATPGFAGFLKSGWSSFDDFQLDGFPWAGVASREIVWELIKIPRACIHVKVLIALAMEVENYSISTNEARVTRLRKQGLLRLKHVLVSACPGTTLINDIELTCVVEAEMSTRIMISSKQLMFETFIFLLNKQIIQ
ncbi:Rhomboid-like protein 16 chloroplastic [Bienertia sinuspersici]